MELGELLGRIGREYDRFADFNSPAQRLLRMAKDEFKQWLPGGFIAQGSGGRGSTAVVPWIAVLDPDVTTTTQDGMHIVYLFSPDQRRVYLTLNQGVTKVVEKFGARGGRNRLAVEASQIRTAMPSQFKQGFVGDLNLGVSGALARGYEAACILSVGYSIDDLPSEVELIDDLRRAVLAYGGAQEIRRQILDRDPDLIVTRANSGPDFLAGGSAEFKPKSDSDYVQEMAARTIIKSRKHESLIARYGAHATTLGYTPNTAVHPRDLVLYSPTGEWLVEAKTVHVGDGVDAVRAALGQLLFYRHFLYSDPRQVEMLALFNESVGVACVDFLEDCRIAVVWQNGSSWNGSITARSCGLV